MPLWGVEVRVLVRGEGPLHDADHITNGSGFMDAVATQTDLESHRVLGRSGGARAPRGLATTYNATLGITAPHVALDRPFAGLSLALTQWFLYHTGVNTRGGSHWKT